MFLLKSRNNSNVSDNVLKQCICQWIRDIYCYPAEFAIAIDVLSVTLLVTSNGSNPSQIQQQLKSLTSQVQNIIASFPKATQETHRHPSNNVFRAKMFLISEKQYTEFLLEILMARENVTKLKQVQVFLEFLLPKSTEEGDASSIQLMTIENLTALTGLWICILSGFGYLRNLHLLKSLHHTCKLMGVGRIQEQSPMRQLNSGNSLNDAHGLPSEHEIFSQVHAWIVDFLNYHFIDTRCLPLSEIFFFEDKESLIHKLRPTDVEDLHLALNNPMQYMSPNYEQAHNMATNLPIYKSNSFSHNDNNQQRSRVGPFENSSVHALAAGLRLRIQNHWLPDVSVVFRLVEECGKQISTYELFKSFHSVVNSREHRFAESSPAHGNKSRKREINVDDSNITNQLCLVRFQRALQMLNIHGFISFNNAGDVAKKISFISF
jgi:hypothetical protein